LYGVRFVYLQFFSKIGVSNYKEADKYLEKATNRLVKELQNKGIKVQTLEPKNNGKSIITFFPKNKIKENSG
tara:strand:- start:119 stop:334 length:216 start_codon:yes stop_codon:yes gene_type:complete